MLDNELPMVMRQAGTLSLARIKKSLRARSPRAGLVGSAAHGAGGAAACDPSPLAATGTTLGAHARDRRP